MDFLQKKGARNPTPPSRALPALRAGVPSPVDPVMSFAPRGPDHAGVTPDYFGVLG